jgi:NAD(P)-dependent dehydrogenase (short-subunit alcohol dehydrogenase family)
MCNSLRVEVAHHGVQVASVHPAWIDTAMVREADEHPLRAAARFDAAAV